VLARFVADHCLCSEYARLVFTFLLSLFFQAHAEAETYPHVYQAAKVRSTLSVLGTKYSLPAGIQREDFKVFHFLYFLLFLIGFFKWFSTIWLNVTCTSQDYEEITIPVTKQAPPTAGEKLVMIADMDNLCKGAFEVCLHSSRFVESNCRKD